MQPSTLAASSVGRPSVLTLAPAHPPTMNRSSGDHGGEATALDEGDRLGLAAAAAMSWPVAGGEDGGEVPPPRTAAGPRSRAPAVRR